MHYILLIIRVVLVKLERLLFTQLQSLRFVNRESNKKKIYNFCGARETLVIRISNCNNN